MSITSQPTRQPGWYYGWNIVVVAIFSQIAANGMTVNAFSLFLKDWSEQLHANISTLQLALAMMGLGGALLAPFIGALADKYPARWLFATGLAGMAIFHIGLSYVTATWQFLALSAGLLPISVCLSTSLVANAVVSRWFVRRLGLALGLTAFGLGAAGAILPPIIAALMPEFGWRAIWRGAGVIIAVVMIPAALLIVRDRPAERDGVHYLTGRPDAVPHHGKSGTSTITWRDILRRPNFWLLLAAYLPILGLYGGCSQNLAPIAASRGLSAQAAGALLSTFSLSYVASTLCMGMLADRFGSKLPLFGLAVATGLGGLTFAFGQGFAILWMGIALVGLGGGLWPLLAAAAAVEFGADAVGRAFGLLTMFVPLVVLVPFTVARLHELTGSYLSGIAALAALTLLGGCACLFMRERPREHVLGDEASAPSDEASVLS